MHLICKGHPDRLHPTYRAPLEADRFEAHIPEPQDGDPWIEYFQGPEKIDDRPLTDWQAWGLAYNFADRWRPRKSAQT